jgi:hypothetical protein
MSAVNIQGDAVVVNGHSINVGLPVLEAQVTPGLVLVLIDPDSYLRDPNYRRQRRSGRPAIRNLRAFSLSGTLLWEAEMPEDADYYHRIVSLVPIDVDSFSSYRCRIDPRTGKIVSKQFMK